MNMLQLFLCMDFVNKHYRIIQVNLKYIIVYFIWIFIIIMIIICIFFIFFATPPIIPRPNIMQHGDIALLRHFATTWRSFLDRQASVYQAACGALTAQTVVSISGY